MNWQEVCEDPHLRNLPYKVELNRYGQILMSPASNEHGRLQTRIAAALMNFLSEGEVITECSIDTSDGTKVADAAWGSSAFFASHGLVTPLPAAPEICVEIVSPGNLNEELEMKTRLYFEKGAKEVWICDSRGTVQFRASDSMIERSQLVPEFPDQI